MILPCITCKFKTERVSGHRAFIGCNDKEKEKENLHEIWSNQYSCAVYEKEVEEDGN